MSLIAGMRSINQRMALVIEDSTTRALHLQALLEQVGLKVLLARGSQEGLQIAQRARPDVVVLDLEMPKMSGSQICLWLKDMRETVSIPLIIFTRCDNYKVAALDIQLDAVDYIPKDAFAYRALLETLRSMDLIAPRTVDRYQS